MIDFEDFLGRKLILDGSEYTILNLVANKDNINIVLDKGTINIRIQYIGFGYNYIIYKNKSKLDFIKDFLKYYSYKTEGINFDDLIKTSSNTYEKRNDEGIYYFTYNEN